MLKASGVNDASKDLLSRLLESNPKHRLKSLLALQRIAFFHNYNFDDVRHMKVSRIENHPTIDHSNGFLQFVEIAIKIAFFPSRFQ